MEANENWSHINEDSDVMGLLQLVQTCMIQRQTRQKPTHTLLDAETQVYAFKQRHLANNEYYEKFKDLVTNAERLGSDIGAHSDRTDGILDEIAADPDMPTKGEKEQAHDRAKDQFLAVMFLVNSDHARYGSLVRDIDVCKHKCFLAKMFYQNIGPSSVHIFHMYGVYFSSRKSVIF
jgi:hypothetical protein